MTGTPADVRTVARKRLEERRGFFPHLIMYVVVNAGLVVIWAATAPDSFFWPAFPLLFWGAGLLMHAWNAFFTKPITETEVDSEVARLGRPVTGHDEDS
ncbi:2TM domain-containing protein [Actinophytocola sp. NPDC049390]|uniref:2TM domain-containing protein n=1 Tax=Actinophytocola sp. NPDC049390 TaxID=3363894 RepID=UPI0037BBFA10